MDAQLIAMAIPFFFVLIGFELFLGRKKGERVYRLYDTITSLSCGVGQQVIGMFLSLATLALYSAVQERVGLFAISRASIVAWLVLMFLLDFCYYAVHRASHRINVIWATHVVHHQSEDYHLATALRQSWFFGVFTILFYLPLAIIGFPVAMFATMLTINTLYQFWIHTRAVGKLGWLEWVLNTPSHHRVHHGIDPKYIDKNYAGMFIIFDRLFGTFALEEEEPIYGTVKRFASFNSWRANLDEWQRIAALAGAASTLADKLYAWIAPPEWRPRDQGGNVVVPEVDRLGYRKFDLPGSRALDLYLVLSFVVVAIELAAGLVYGEAIALGGLAAMAVMVLVNLLGWGGMIEGRRWALPLELARLAASLALVHLWTRSLPSSRSVTVLAAAVAVLLALLAVRANRAPRMLRDGAVLGG